MLLPGSVLVRNKEQPTRQSFSVDYIPQCTLVYVKFLPKRNVGSSIYKETNDKRLIFWTKKVKSLLNAFPQAN